MNVKGEYVLREIAGDYILIPIGSTALEKNGIITMDEVGVSIWKGIVDGKTEEEILKDIIDTYDVEEMIAKKDLEEFLEKLKEEELIEE